MAGALRSCGSSSTPRISWLAPSTFYPFSAMIAKRSELAAVIAPNGYQVEGASGEMRGYKNPSGPERTDRDHRNAIRADIPEPGRHDDREERWPTTHARVDTLGEPTE
jgi:hypothetical protein